MVDFREVVILACQPEDRHTTHPGASSLVGEFDRSQRLENREQWSAEQSDLLACDRCRSACAQARDVFQGLRRSIPGLILPLQNCADTLPPSGVIAQVRSFVLYPLGEMRRPGIKLLDLGKIVEEITKQPGGVRDLAEGQTLRLHRRLS
jgi:hypothetical protein